MAYLNIALENWRKTGDDTYEALRSDTDFNLAVAIVNACEAMYAGGRETVFCRPPPGRSIQKFYSDCGENGQSIIVTAPREPIIMTDAAAQVPEWMQLMERLLFTAPAEKLDALHIWAMREPPIIDCEPANVRALLAFGELQRVIWAARCIWCSNDPTAWKRFNDHAVIAILKKDESESLGDPDAALIDPGAVFPTEVPRGWKVRGVASGDITSLVTIGLTDTVTFSSFVRDPRYPVPPVLELPPPTPDSKSSFLHLHSACRQFLGDVANGHDVKKGWLLLKPEDFIGQAFPLEGS